MALTKKRAIWIAAESTYGTDPSANGSGYSAVPAFAISDLADGKEPEVVDYMTARPYPSKRLAGSIDGWEFSFEVPLIGLGTAAGDGGSPPADDWLDIILEHIFGVQRAVDGEGIATVPDSTGFTVDAGDPYNAQDLVAIYESGVPAAATRSQWAFIAADNGTQDYDIAPAYAENPSASAIAYGTNIYRLDDDGGPSIAVAYEDDGLIYECLGGRITSARAVGEVGKAWRLALTISGNTKTEDASGKTSLPDALSAPAITPCEGLLSPVWFAGTKYATKMVEIDFGIEATEIFSTEDSGGRTGFQNVGMAPSVTIEPLRTDAIMDLKRNQTAGALLVQIGGGVLSGGVLNTCCVYAQQAQAREVTASDDSGLARQRVVFDVTDNVNFSSGVAAFHFQFARA